MKVSGKIWLAAAALGFTAMSVQADDLKGVIESVDAQNRTFTVQGITFHTKDSTDYEDALRSFDDLTEGQNVDVDFKIRDGKHVATDVGLDD